MKRVYSEGLIDLHAPCILPFEVINGLKYTYHLGKVELRRISHVLEDLQITLQNFHEIMDDIISFSLKYGITIYDPSYVALAKALNDVMYNATRNSYIRLRI